MEKISDKRHLLSLPEFVQSKKFWDATLGMKEGDTRLPYSFYPTGSYVPSRLLFNINDPLRGLLGKISKGNHNALYLLLVTSYKILLHKYSGQRFIEVGLPSMDQNIGYLSPSQLLSSPSHINPALHFKELLKHEQELFANISANQHYPLNEIEKYKIPKTSIALKNIHNRNETTDLDLVFTQAEAGISLEIIYNSELFSQKSIQVLGQKIQHVANTLLSNPEKPIEEMNFVEADEEHMYLEIVNATYSPYPSESNLVQAFQNWARNTPNEIAVAMGEDFFTYKDLDLYSNKIANYLFKNQQIKNGSPVGILLPKSIHSLACILGILKAGGAYLPLSPKYPADRLRSIIKDAGIQVLLSSKNHIKMLHRLQWECPELATFMCIDSENCHLEQEEASLKNELNDQKLWEYVGEKAKDDIEGGGWQNSYTGEHLSRAEMDEYRDNILNKLKPHLSKDTRILEIGCASGISMFALAPYVGLYYGTDISRAIIEKNKATASAKNLHNIRLKSLAAHEIGQVDEKDFDIVIINSVIQCFEGHNYLTKVLNQCIHLLKDEGRLFIGDVMNEETREEFLGSLIQFKKDNIGKGYKVKTDLSNEMFFTQKYFEDLRAIIPQITDVQCSNKIHSIPNELTKYRFDATLLINKKKPTLHYKASKQQHSLGELAIYDETQAPNVEISPNHLAYILYTSGSTGKPKGVMISHKNVLRLVKNTNYLPFAKGDKMLQAAPMEFDAASFEIWGGLANGLPVHILDQETFLNASKLKDYLIAHQVNTSVIISSTFVALLEQDIDVFKGFKHLLVGGEALSTHHINKLRSHDPNINLVNAYGPTENTVISTYHPIKQSYNGPIPIGRPISNSYCYVLDEKMRLVMPLSEGVLYVGGDGVAQGYLNSPELTQQKFVPNPFKKGDTLYCTGDLVRWNENYELEFIGRIDTQVKIRGHRVETGEIENELLNIAGIKAAKVTTKSDDNNDKSLVAYFTATSKIDPEEIISLLEDKLPNYMVPSMAIQLDSLPLNANGKLDTAQLPDIGPLTKQKGTYEAPRNETEEMLMAIWKEVLNVPSISINDNFFELGGHSLKAMKVLHKLSKNYELKLTLLFKHQTIKDLAPHLVFKKGHLLETLKRLKEEPLDEATLAKAKERKAWYQNRIQHDPYTLPGSTLEIENVLLTGVTGYLGVHLLKELLCTSNTQVYVIVRANNDSQAVERLRSKTNFYFGDSFYGQYKHRIEVLCGDMALPQLGIPDDAYTQLCSQIDTIMNPAANVKHYGQDNEYLGNTLGVQTLVQIAKTGKAKRLHHVSTAGVSFGQGYAFTEYDRVDQIPDENNTTYLQSKLDAEKIIFKAMEDGVDAVIHRVGNLMFNTETGHFQENTENSAFYMLLRSFIHLGIMPDMYHQFYDFSYINTTAKAIVSIAKQKSLTKDTFHVYNPNAYSLHDLYHSLIQPNFKEVKLVPLDAFPDMILQKHEDPNMREYVEHIIVNIRILEIKESNVMVLSDRSQGIMEKLGVSWRPLDHELSQMMLSFGKEKKFW